MGSCTSCTNVLLQPISRNKSNFSLRRDCDIPNNATPSPRVTVQEKRRDSFADIRDKCSSIEQLEKYFLISKVSDKKRSLHLFKSLSLTSADHTLHSESCSTRNLLSYDGLNKRPLKRDDITMDILKAKVHFGANPNKMCTHGNRTCLMFAVVANDFSFTKKLVELGVDINKVTPSGETALSLAIEMQNNELVNYLRSKGASDVVLSLA